MCVNLQYMLNQSKHFMKHVSNITPLTGKHLFSIFVKTTQQQQHLWNLKCVFVRIYKLVYKAGTKCVYIKELSRFFDPFRPHLCNSSFDGRHWYLISVGVNSIINSENPLFLLSINVADSFVCAVKILVSTNSVLFIKNVLVPSVGLMYSGNNYYCLPRDHCNNYYRLPRNQL
jgi:hypothetical protein